MTKPPMNQRQRLGMSVSDSVATFDPDTRVFTRPADRPEIEPGCDYDSG